MQNWKTSKDASGSEFRKRIGLQFFAEGDAAAAEGAGEGSADMDGFDGNGFVEGLLGGDGEDQTDVSQTENEDAPAGGEDQTAGGQQEKPGEEQTAAEDKKDEGAKDKAEKDKPAEDKKDKAEKDKPAEKTPAEAPVTIQYKDTRFEVPGAAVEQIGKAIGKKPGEVAELIQKGMHFDSKNARELHILDEFARASGMDRAAYVTQLEAMAEEQRVTAEAEQIKAKYPGTTDEAALALARERVQTRKAAERQQQQEQANRLAAGQERVNAVVQQTRKAAEAKEWDKYVTLAGITKVSEVPERVIELVRGGHTPTEAHYIFEKEKAEAALATAKKEKENKKQSPGSMSGAGQDETDDFLKGLFS